METVRLLPAFLLAVLLISASPGPAMALVFRRAALRGFRPTVATVLGLELGIYLWALAAAVGLAALVAASHTAYLVLKIVGAGFLACLGVRSLLAAWRGRGADDATAEPADAEPRAGSAWTAFTEGLAVQVANPKAAVFMFVFYPQFVSADQPLLATTAALALLQVAVETALYLGLAAGVARVGGWFRRPVVRRRLEAATGTVLLALAGRLAVSAPRA